MTHPGICTIYALEEIDDELFLVTEFIDGATLRDEIASGRRRSAAEIMRTAGRSPARSPRRTRAASSIVI